MAGSAARAVPVNALWHLPLSQQVTEQIVKDMWLNAKSNGDYDIPPGSTPGEPPGFQRRTSRRQLLSLADAARISKCSKKHIKAHILKGTLKAKNIGLGGRRYWRIRKKDFDGWLQTYVEMGQ